jgi:hypothetical protein
MPTITSGFRIAIRAGTREISIGTFNIPTEAIAMYGLMERSITGMIIFRRENRE